MSAQAGRTRREATADLLGVALAALTGLAFLAEDADAGRESEGYLLLSGVVMLAGSLSLWWRRRWPVGVAAGLLPTAVLTESTAGAILLAVLTVAVRRSWRVTAAVVAAHCLAAVPYTLRRPEPDLAAAGVDAAGQALWAIGASAVLMLPFAWWGAVVRARRAELSALRERAERAEDEARAVAERVRARERAHLAREMHDVLAHRISLVSLHAGALELRPSLPPEEVAEAARTIRASAHLALEDLREILGVLRHGEAAEEGVRPLPGLDRVAELVAERRAAGTPVDVDDQLPEGEEPSFAVSRTAYRVVQEGLTNAGKHAPGARVGLRLARTPEGELHISLRNLLPAASAPVVPGSRSGLIGLAERAELTGGRLDYGVRRAEEGRVEFRLEAWLPWSGSG
ncbi:sensor histidine kinase [Streptomyces sp. 7-21]|uniref:sensor histidine kinase n=1 Tax=Streptomyces sp. 7-21 TaxID=2802283 RepID=UPI00191D5720|nr:histidine kinase [Streptomyces sp. 7-21]MBL1067071.1 sensor histidine kinase [Streptomyces sp. 7-21]